MQEAKTHLSRWVDEALGGEEIIFSKSGRPCVRLVPCPPEREERRLGAWKGRVHIAADFDAPDPALERLLSDSRLEPAARPKSAARPRPAVRKPARGAR